MAPSGNPPGVKCVAWNGPLLSCHLSTPHDWIKLSIKVKSEDPAINKKTGPPVGAGLIRLKIVLV